MEKNKYFSQNLRVLRHLNKYSQEMLAKELGYKSFTTVQKWEDNTSYPKLDNLAKISELFNVNLSHLLFEDISKMIKDKKAVPILGHVSAGLGVYAEEDFFGYEYVDEASKGQTYFYLKVTGDSMIDARIYDGDIIYVRKQSTIENKEIAVVLLENNEATVKRVLIDKSGITLVAENKIYPPRYFTYQEVEAQQIKILGKVIHNKIMF